MSNQVTVEPSKAGQVFKAVLTPVDEQKPDVGSEAVGVTEAAANNATQQKATQQLDIDALRTQIRKDEYGKVRNELSQKDATIATLQENVTTLTTRLAELEKQVKEKDEAVTQQKKAQEGDEQALSEVSKKIMDTLDKKVLELKNRIEELDNIRIQKEEANKQAELKAKREAELAAYRVKKITEAGGKLIPDLVVGSNEEEIDAAVEISKVRYKEIEQQVRGQRQQTPAPGPTGDEATAVRTTEELAGLEGESDEVKLEREILSVSTADYAKNRDRYLAMAAKLAKGGSQKVIR